MRNTRLPLDWTSFVGRDAELERLAGLVQPSRLITLTGSPGTGKTRLARELLQRRPPEAPPAAWVELAALQEAGLVVPAVSAALGLPDDLRAGDLPALTRLVGEREFFLILDNCEHLVETVAQVAAGLLAACPGVALLATSREALGVTGERAWLVPGLGLPEGGGDPRDAEAVRLFLERAREGVPDFEPDPEALAAIVDICVRLDGIPLALELAAARVRHVAPGDILRRLDDVFRLLVSDLRTAIPRHRTLRAAIDWSYELLDPGCRTLLARLAIFQGGFTLAAAEAVAGDDDPGPEGDSDVPVLESLSRLVDRSLVVVRERAGTARYHLLESVRQYALERLRESGEEARLGARHTSYYLSLVEEAGPHLLRPGRRNWIDRLDQELGNLRAALDTSLREDPERHAALAGALWWFWFSTQHWTEAGRWIEGALALDEARHPGPVRARLLFASGALAALQVRPRAARPALQEAEKLARELGDGRLAAYSLNYLGLTWAGEGDPRAAKLCREAARWFTKMDDLYGLRLALLLQGSAAQAAGRLEEAEALNREGVAVARRFGEPRELAISLQNLAAALIVRGRYAEAEALVLEAMGNSRRDVSYYFIATGVAYLAEIRAHQGRPGDAAWLLGAAEAIRERVGGRAFPMDRARVDAILPGLQEALGEAGFQETWARGRAVRPESLVAELAEAGESGGGEAPARSDGAVTEVAARASSVEAVAPAAPAAPSPQALQVWAMGAFRVVVEGDAVPEERWSYAKPRELLVYLLLHPAGRTRDQITAALWPEAAPGRAKNSFHVTLHHLRKALDRPDWIGIEGERYRLDPAVGVHLDATAYEARARMALEGGGIASLRSALAAWTGELLEGETVGRWVDPHREQLGRLHLQVALALGEELEASDPGEAAALYRELAGREELNEEVHRRYMRTLVQAGDRAGALRHYDRLVILLADGLDADPEPETRALYDSIRSPGEELGTR